MVADRDAGDLLAGLVGDDRDAILAADRDEAVAAVAARTAGSPKSPRSPTRSRVGR
jgi:hypothetical protein